ncbi:hypothetical protein B9G69_005970 [Bdellovibrio sp. SKB1291214]|uniref:hypothetical protein n=1 Tax=Bdellovibrio sp. SKB1291214 TaxID=1732569 RepID=UPI0022404A70|nr:hypothetical protein [Bdellovibrio sp. SKB1291214]UYL10124.1 hypothetical protein B9G69_005970 [Bdellovibrio sp. SKB1291214]
MKSLVIALSFLVAAPAFATSSNECITQLLQKGYFLDQAKVLCTKSETATCNVSAIMAETGYDYSRAASLCPRSYKSNAAINECVAQGYDYSACAQMNH